MDEHLEKRYTKLANVLRIVDGKVIAVDGRDIQEYLKKWQETINVEDNTSIVIITRQRYIEMMEEIRMWQYACGIG